MGFAERAERIRHWGLDTKPAFPSAQQEEEARVLALELDIVSRVKELTAPLLEKRGEETLEYPPYLVKTPDRDYIVESNPITPLIISWKSLDRSTDTLGVRTHLLALGKDGRFSHETNAIFAQRYHPSLNLYVHYEEESHREPVTERLLGKLNRDLHNSINVEEMGEDIFELQDQAA